MLARDHELLVRALASISFGLGFYVRYFIPSRFLGENLLTEIDTTVLATLPRLTGLCAFRVVVV